MLETSKRTLGSAFSSQHADTYDDLQCKLSTVHDGVTGATAMDTDIIYILQIHRQ